MAKSLVERLRARCPGLERTLRREAADEIERLEEQVTELMLLCTLDSPKRRIMDLEKLNAALMNVPMWYQGLCVGCHRSRLVGHRDNCPVAKAEALYD